MSDWRKALNWGRLLHLSQKQRLGVISDQELVEMRQLRGQQQAVNARVRGTLEPHMREWSRI